MKVLVTDKINVIAKELIETDDIQVDILPTMSEDELTSVIGNYEALMVRSQTKVTQKIIEAGKNLKIIGRAGVGVDNIDVDSATQNGIIVVNSPDGNTNAAAEHTIALMLSMARNIPQAYESTKQGLWERSKFTGVEVFGKTLGIIGLGKIGSHVAEVAKALGMNVLVYDPYTAKEKVENMGGEYVQNLEDFWARPDFISVHVPKTQETTGLINELTLAKMKDGVRIINCARGGIIDERALKDSIEKGKVKSCAIDVFEDEPNIQNCCLTECCDKAILTPHLGASTSEAQLNVAIDVAKQIKQVLEGGSATSAVNIPSLRPDKLEPVKDYMKLAENIAEVAEQIADGYIKEAEIIFQGSLSALNTSALEVAILKGLLSSFMTGVNYVNAPILAKQKGISIKTVKTDEIGNYIGAITVKVITDNGVATVSGALIAKDIKRITQINNYNTSIEPEEHMLLVPHENKPAMIAKVATVISDMGININHMSVSPSVQEKNVSVMIINTDQNIDASCLNKIKAIDGIINSKYVHLS